MNSIETIAESGTVFSIWPLIALPFSIIIVLAVLVPALRLGLKPLVAQLKRIADLLEKDGNK